MSHQDSSVAGRSGVPSHTSTNQWQSFELRMRLRRAERCILRAEVALEAGFPDEARAALDEARRLDSSAPDFETLSATIAPWPPPEPPARRGVPIALFAAIMSVALAAGAAGAYLMGAIDPAVPGVPTEPTQVPTPRRADVTLAATRSSPSRSVAAITTEFVRPEIERAAPRKVPDPAIGKINQPTLGGPAPDAGVRKPEETSAEPPPSLPLPAAPPVAVGTTATLTTVPAGGLPPILPETPPAGDDRPQVRAVLARYEAAYSSLSVDDVRSVWPEVDARSLSRAFDGLTSQRVSLGQCSMTVGTNTARADCRGTATWTPRIGGGTHRENRTWQFELRNVAGNWQIARASAR